jgi:uncharacterized membrane protein YtjA (UPF0391 family)
LWKQWNFTTQPRVQYRHLTGDFSMLRWALFFLLLGLVAGLLGFTGIAGASFAIAKILFFVFVVIFLLLLIGGLTIARKIEGG